MNVFDMTRNLPDSEYYLFPIITVKIWLFLAATLRPQIQKTAGKVSENRTNWSKPLGSAPTSQIIRIPPQQIFQGSPFHLH